MAADIAQHHSNNKCYASAYIYIYIDIDKRDFTIWANWCNLKSIILCLIFSPYMAQGMFSEK